MTRDEIQGHPAGCPAALFDDLAAGKGRVLLFGEPGVGKSTLAADLARRLLCAGVSLTCIGADPGLPAFGVPGAICSAAWQGDGWGLTDVEALCSLDAARFRLPLIAGVRRIVERLPPGPLLIDPPGVVRGVAGAELLTAMIEAADIDTVLTLTPPGQTLPLGHELAALPVKIFSIEAVPEARRPSKRQREEHRTRLWDTYLRGAVERWIELDDSCLLGTPPPLDAPEAWRGRQAALLDGRGATLALGEVVCKEDGALRVRLAPHDRSARTILLVRDARRTPAGRLCTAEPSLASVSTRRGPPPDMVPAPGLGHAGGPCPFVHVGPVTAALVNGVFGDPLLHLRLRQKKRSMLFDLGEAGRLPARIAHQVSDVFVSHAHFDHISGFLWLLRSRIGEEATCRLFGPPGLASHIEGLVRGIRWDRIGNRGPRFDVTELHGGGRVSFRVQAGRCESRWLGERGVVDGVLLEGPDFRVRAATLDHGTPVLAFAFEASRRLHVRKDRLAARDLKLGPWLGALKRHVMEDDLDASVRLPNGTVEPAGSLADELIAVTSGEKLVYAVDLADTHRNRTELAALAQGAHTLFCEAAFAESEAIQARETGHLTAKACGEIARAAGVARLVPFHLSRRYETEPERIYREVQATFSRTVVPRGLDLDRE